MLVYTPQHTNRWTIFSAPLEQIGLDFDGNGPWIKRIRAAKTDTMRNRIECKQEGGGEEEKESSGAELLLPPSDRSSTLLFHSSGPSVNYF